MHKNDDENISKEEVDSKNSSSDGVSVWPIIIALVFMILASIEFFTYDFPSGNDVGIIDYILFFNKDLLIFPVAIAFIILIIIKKIKR